MEVNGGFVLEVKILMCLLYESHNGNLLPFQAKQKSLSKKKDSWMHFITGCLLGPGFKRYFSYDGHQVLSSFSNIYHILQWMQTLL